MTKNLHDVSPTHTVQQQQEVYVMEIGQQEHYSVHLQTSQ